MTQTLESQLEKLQLTDPLETLSQGEIDQIPKIKAINYLELFNFKSYADYHYIGPMLDFSCIVGPNGGGKSNILDALCFLFCINPKNSRVYSLTELIYSKAKVQNGRSTAEQRECWVAGSFSCEQTDALKLRRSLNSNGTSEFHVNNQKVSVEEYYKYLYKNNINTYAKNFLIMQGEAVSLIEKSPKDLSLVFEYLSGSIVFKDKYEELKIASEEKEKELKEQIQRLGHLKSERRKVREKIENSNEYNRLLKEHDEVELMNQLVKLLEIDGQCYESLKILRESENEIEEYKKTRDDENLKLQGYNVEKRNILGNIRKEQKNLELKKEEVSKLRAELNKDGTLKDMTEQTIQAKRITQEKFEREIKNLQNNQRDYDTAIIELEKKLKDLDNVIQKKKEDPSETLVGKDYDEYKELTQKMKIRSHLLSQELEKLYCDQKIFVTRIEKVEEENQRRRNIISKIEIELKESRTALINRQAEINKLVAEEKKLNGEIGEVSKRKEEKVRGKDSLQILRDEKNKRLMNHELLTLNQKDENKTLALTIELRNKAKGFKDELRRLIKPITPKYEVALRLALGGALRYLIVDKNATAVTCSSILKDKSVMKDILVLENIPEVNTTNLNTIRNQIRGLGNFVSDVVDFERSVVGLEKALLFLLEGRIVCDNLSKAEQIRKKNIEGVREIITLDGNVIKKGVIIGYGNVENLSLGGQFAGSLGGNLDEELKAIQKEISEFEEKIKGLKTDEEDLELHKLTEKMREIETKVNAEREEISKLQNKCNKDEEELNRERGEANKVTHEFTKLADNRKKIEVDINGVKNKLEKLEEEVFGEFCRKRGISSVKEFRGQNVIEYERVLEEKEKVEKNLKIKRKERNDLPLGKYEETLKEIAKTLKEKETHLAEILERLATNNKKIETVNNVYEKSKNALEEYTREESKLEREISAIEKSYEGERANYLEKEKAKNEAVNKLNHLFQRKKATIEELQIKSITIPTASSSSVNTPKDLFEEYKDLVKKYLTNSSQTQIDYSLLVEKHPYKSPEESREGAMEVEESESQEPEEVFQKWFEGMKDDKLRQMKEEYEASLVTLGHRIDNYAGTSFPAGQESTRRLNRFEDEIEETKRAVNALTKEFDQVAKEFDNIKQKRVSVFDKFFDKLSAKIDEVYKSLTRKPDGVVGKAIVYKENKDEPFNGGVFYSATPPSKKFVYDIEQLSGGEKTMAGLALILTANLVSGFPFMFFDESDAFLDHANTKQLLEVIKLFVEKNLMQIIVVTHKNMIYGNAQSLVGATFVPRQFTSEAYSLDLRK